ncbi:serine hydrolase domain-containing protein [Amycolatopsis sp. CA-230715]|uniref:serine hydrolase domain-containing protein n=1 Tax=Amycolatopsis sp. CA-230715 TaxID=2745196 RepID=UPI001C00BAE3|nr:serine hydrolase domain-containing protein [Amycolatopsis sp. CA-230715]QWF80757.1 hypothetical protein HUW46_04181 [Amycolatopsis sp. CA-230715]
MEALRGTVAAGFEPVRDEFAEVVLGEGGDFAAQLVAYRHGERVVDLWTGPEITGDSLLGAFSASKGAAHLVVALLVQDGVLELDRRVSHYWPEFAVEGKRDITVREVLAHRAGLVGADAGFALAELADDRVVAERLGGQRPYWRPGTAFGYHALVVAALSGEVVRRATGATIQEHFAARVRDTYTVDFYLGLPSNQEFRYLAVEPAPEPPGVGVRGLPGIAFNRHHPGNPELWRLPNFRVIRANGPASLGGVASARGMARMYAAAISSVDGMAPLLKPDTAAAFAQIQSVGYDLVTRAHKTFGVGFHATSEVYPELGQGAFGHSGAGGQQAFADPRNSVAYGYSRRRFPCPSGPAPENARLISALYASFQRSR